MSQIIPLPPFPGFPNFGTTPTPGSIFTGTSPAMPQSAGRGFGNLHNEGELMIDPSGLLLADCPNDKRCCPIIPRCGHGLLTPLVVPVQLVVMGLSVELDLGTGTLDPQLGPAYEPQTFQHCQVNGFLNITSQTAAFSDSIPGIAPICAIQPLDPAFPNSRWEIMEIRGQCSTSQPGLILNDIPCFPQDQSPSYVPTTNPRWYAGMRLRASGFPQGGSGITVVNCEVGYYNDDFTDMPLAPIDGWQFYRFCANNLTVHAELESPGTFLVNRV